MEECLFPRFSFAGNSDQYQVITTKNSRSLSLYMQKNGLKKMIIISDENNIGWNEDFLPELGDFLFLEELLIHWTNIKNIDGIHSCVNLKTLRIDNDDRTEIDFSCFPNIEEVVSWDRKNIKAVWSIPTLKRLTLAGVNKMNFSYGIAIKSIEKLRIIKTTLMDISFLSEANRLLFLELLNFNKIEDLSPLQTLIQLKHLRISANKVKDFSFIKHLINLETLYISSKIGVFSKEYFSGLTKLKKINLSGNPEIQRFNKELQFFLR